MVKRSPKIILSTKTVGANVKYAIIAALANALIVVNMSSVGVVFDDNS